MWRWFPEKESSGPGGISVFARAFYTLVSMEFKKLRGGTEMTFTHYGVPDSFAKRLTAGWKEYYWNRIKAFLGN